MKLSYLSSKNVKEGFRVSIRTRLLHWALAALAILVFPFFFVIGPMEKKAQEARDQTGDLREKVEKVLLIGQGNPDMELVLTRLNDEHDLLKSKVLRKNEQAKVISLLSQTIEDLNMQILNIAPQQPEKDKNKPEEETTPTEGVVIRPALFRLELVSRYKTLAVFFERLKHAPLLFTIEEFSADVDPKIAPYLHVDMVIAAYEEWTI